MRFGVVLNATFDGHDILGVQLTWIRAAMSSSKKSTGWLSRFSTLGYVRRHKSDVKSHTLSVRKFK